MATETMDWKRESGRILKAELARKGVTYRQLAETLKGMGIPENESGIANKISRGGFSFYFFLQCMAALGKNTIEVSLEEMKVPE